MIGFNKKTKRICLLIVLLLTIMVGYFYNLLILNKADSLTKANNVSGIKEKAIIKDLKNIYQKTEYRFKPKQSCCCIKIQITKLVSLGCGTLEGCTVPMASITINGETKTKADSKGIFKAECFPLKQNLIIEVVDSNGNRGRLIRNYQ